MKRLLTFFFCVATAVMLQAQIRGNSVVVTVEPDHADWHYKTGEKVDLPVEVRQEGELLHNVALDSAVGAVM